MAVINARLDLSPADAVRYFESKGDRLTWDYTDVWREANAHAFTVAKATTDDVLRTIRAEVSKAIGQGQTFEAFKRSLRPRLEALGWWGTQEVLDANTGELTRVQLGSNRRLRTIFQTNVQTSYMAGRYKRYLANVTDRPYWRYVAIMDSRTRPDHAALNGRVFRWDDPIWAIIWPPNGWGCRCRVIALTEAEFQALGAPLENSRDAIVERTIVLNKAGDTATVQGFRYKGADGKDAVFLPDPGWDYNPGAAWSRFDPAAFKGDAIGLEPVTPRSAAGHIKAIEGQRTWADLGLPDLRDGSMLRLPNPGLLPSVNDREQARQAVLDTLLPAGQVRRSITTPVGDVVIRSELLPQIVEGVRNGRERYANYLIPALETPLEVWLTAYSDGSYRKRYIALFEGRGNVLLMVRENRDGSLFWEVYNMMSTDAHRLNRLREGVPLFRRGAGSS